MGSRLSAPGPQERRFAAYVEGLATQVIVSLIAATTTATGLKVHSELDTTSYPSGIKVSDREIAKVNLRRDKFHGAWNYEIHPHRVTS